MKKINSKGFVLIETLVVSVFVLVIFVLIFRNGVPMIEEYQKLENYDDIDSLYTASLIRDIIKKDVVKSDDGSTYIPTLNYLTDILNDTDMGYVDLTDCTKLSDVNLCHTVKLRTSITDSDKIFLTYSNPSKIKGKVLTDDRRFTSYIDYLVGNYNENLISSPYMIIVTRTIENTNPFLDEKDIEKYEETKTVKFGSIEIG